jgi:dipeptidyl aminopeptidase/acylaminoacyl peptidase
MTSQPSSANPGSGLIPRAALYGNPDRADVQLSPDGRYLSFLAPVDGVLNVWVGPADDVAAAQPVTADTRRGVRTHDWAYTSRHVLYPQDIGGDEDWHTYVVDVQTRETLDLTPIDGVATSITAVSKDFPDEVLISINDRVPELHDVYRVNVITGARELVKQNPGFVGFVARDDYTLPLAMMMTQDGGALILKERDGGDGGDDTGEEMGGYIPFISVPMQDSLNTQPLGFTMNGASFFMLDSRDRDKAALMQVALADGRSEVIFTSDVADVDSIMSHPTEKTIQAVAVNHLRSEWTALDPQIGADLDVLQSVADGEILVVSRTLDDRYWIVAFYLDDGPVRYYRYRRSDRSAEFLFTNRSDLDAFALTKKHPLIIPARDGLELVSYLSLPVWADPGATGRPSTPLPTVLLVHGGPWARDAWGFDPEHQLLANRGYAVLSVNYRGSTGFGKAFLNAGNLEWGARMHDDLLDAVDWAVAEGIADREKVAISGGSYGGYATLAGLTMTPEVFACGVDIVGPSNILTLLESIPAYWEPMIQMFKDRVGDFTTDEGRAFLASRSPLTHVQDIRRPLLIGQGKNDPRVKEAESEQIVSAMEAHGIPVTYVLFADEGHGFAEPANRLSFFAVTEAFLAQHLGGRAEPYGDVFARSSITVPSGASGVPGLSEAL